MPVVPVDVDSSTVVVTSAISAVITFGFCTAMDLTPGLSLAIAVVVGVALYNLGVIPIGLLAIVGFAMVVAIFKKVFGSSGSQK